VDDEGSFRSVTCGVPQGSVFGPILWNAAYDDLSTMPVPVGVHLVGFADDLAVVCVARTGLLLEDLINPVLEQVDRWMSSRGLQLKNLKNIYISNNRDLKVSGTL